MPPPNFPPAAPATLAQAAGGTSTHRVRLTRRRPRAAWIAGFAVVALIAAAAVVLFIGNTASSPEQAIAEAINLHASDLPGFTVEAAHHSSTGAQFDAQSRACIGSLGTTPSGGTLADVRSPTFTSGSGLLAEQVFSDVTVKRSADLVRSDLARASGAPVGRCIARTLDGITVPTSSGAVVTFGDVQVGRLAAQEPGTNGGFGIRIAMTMSALGRGVPVFMDLWGYAVGRDELTLMTTAIERPLSSQSERQLSSLLIERALARPH